MGRNNDLLSTLNLNINIFHILIKSYNILSSIMWIQVKYATNFYIICLGKISQQGKLFSIIQVIMTTFSGTICCCRDFGTFDNWGNFRKLHRYRTQILKILLIKWRSFWKFIGNRMRASRWL